MFRFYSHFLCIVQLDKLYFRKINVSSGVGAGKSSFRIGAGRGAKVKLRSRRVKAFFGSRQGGEQKRDSARGGEKFFLVGTRRGVKNLPRFGLWCRLFNSMLNDLLLKSFSIQ